MLPVFTVFPDLDGRLWGEFLENIILMAAYSFHFCAPRFAELWRQLTFGFIFVLNLLITTAG